MSISAPKGGHAPDRVYTLSAQSDDHPADTSTTAEVEVGGSLQTYLMRTKTNYNSSATDDVDWIRVALSANVHYRFVYDVACLHEGIIEGIYDSDGALVPDSGSSIARKTDGTCTDLTMAFTAPGDGDYYVAVTARGSYYPENKRHPFGGVYGTLKVDGTITTSMGQRANSPATGGPGITGTVQAGETLTATTDGIEDEDGLTGAVFAYQWVRSGADIEGAASSTYTVTGDDEGKPIQVRVTFTDDAGNAESLTSYAKLSAPPLIIPDEEPPPESTATREAREAQGAQEAAETPLTAAIHDAPESHDGQEDFTFELRFSEEPKEGFSDNTLRDHAFTVTGGEVAGARKLDGDSATPNIRWEITVSPDSNANVTVELPAHRGLRGAGGHLHRGRHDAVQPAGIHRQGASADGKLRERPDVPQRQRRIQIQDRLQRGVFAQLQDAAGRPCVHGGGRQGNRRAAAGQGQQHRLGDRRQTGLQRRRDDHSARHHGLRRAEGHLHRRRQDAVQPLGAHRHRAGRVVGNEKGREV